MVEIKTELKQDLNVNIPEETYAIGLYEGKTPFDLISSVRARNPIVSRKNASSRQVNFVADPFAIYENGMWYLFYESMAIGTRKGTICVATSPDKYEWTTGKIVLEETFHLSYPQVFKYGNEFYMVPESYEADEVRLYKSGQFPFKWQFEKVLLSKSCVDSTLFFKGDVWWMFTCDAPHEHNRLGLYYSDSLYGEWKEHPQSPIREYDNQNSRPAGKLLQYKGKLYRFAQDCALFYGHSVRVFEIEVLDLFEYKDTELEVNPFLEAGNEKWNRVSMHHVDLHEIEENHWIAFVDGRSH